MWWNKSLVIVLLVVFLFSGGLAFAGCPSYDLTGDWRVDLEDLAVMAAEWLVSYDLTDLGALANQWLDEGNSDFFPVFI